MPFFTVISKGREESCHKQELQKFHTLNKNMHTLNNASTVNNDNKLKNQEASSTSVVDDMHVHPNNVPISMYRRTKKDT